MPEPQPGAEPPADGNTPGPPPSSTEARDPVLPGQPSSSAAAAEETAPTRAEPVAGEGTADTGEAAAPPATRIDPAPQATRVEGVVPPDGTRVDPARPDPTKIDRGPEPERSAASSDPAESGPATPPAPRWSGSAPVPPPRPKKRGWGHSAEPTPPPPPPAPPAPPEHQVPVDPWAGADTGSWDLNAGYEPLPPTRSYPTPPSTPTPSWSPPPVTPVSGQPVPPPVPRPVSPPPARPVSPPPARPPIPPARPVSPPSYPSPPVARPVSPPPARPVSTPPPARQVPPPVVPAQQQRTPPPGWQAPQGYAPPQPRRRRRWPTRMLILTLLSLACCCGCPAYFGKPMWEQYPASASLPPVLADLRLQSDARSESTATELRTEVEGAHLLAEEVFAGVYGTPQGKNVTVFGSTGFRFTPESDAEEELTRLTSGYNLGEQQVVETDVRGEHERCAVGRAEGTAVVVCTWADHGSLASAVFTRLSLTDSAALLGTLRDGIVTRG